MIIVIDTYMKVSDTDQIFIVKMFLSAKINKSVKFYYSIVRYIVDNSIYIILV